MEEEKALSATGLGDGITQKNLSPGTLASGVCEASTEQGARGGELCAEQLQDHVRTCESFQVKPSQVTAPQER